MVDSYDEVWCIGGDEVVLIVRYLIELEFEEDCDPCATCEDCEFGGIAFNRNNPDYRFQFGNSPGKISMSGTVPSPSLVDRNELTITPSAFAYHDNGDLIRADAPTTYVEFSDITNGYKMDLYHGVHPSGTYIKTVEVTSPDPNATDGFELYIDDAGKVSGYIYNEAANRWDFVEGAGSELRRTKTTRGSLLDSEDAVIGAYSETTVFNDDDQVVSKTRRERTQFPFGMKLTREINAPGEPEEFWTEYTYYDDNGDPGDGDNYGHLKSTVSSDGSWTEYLEYDDRGRVLKQVRQLGNSTDATWQGANRSHETIYASGLTTRREYEDGQLVRLEWTERPSLAITRHIVATDPGATGPEDTTNLVTTTRTYLAGPGRQKTHYVVYPDGTALLNEYTEDTQSGHSIHVAYRGVPDSITEPTAINDGTRTETETETDAQNRVVSREVTDIATGIVLEKTTYDDPDVLGRYQEILHLNGLSYREYACCGLVSETGIDGVQRIYGRDSLGRRNTTHHYFDSALTGGTKRVFDAMGRTVEEIQIADDESERTVAEWEYDMRGRVIASKDALSRETTFAHTEENGYLVTTETRPDDGTVVTRYYQDGRLYERTGSGLVSSVRYAYGTTTNGETTTLETILDATGNPTAEYTLTVTDIAGRTVRVERPNPAPEATEPAITQFAHNGLGQLHTVTDPDDVETRYGYSPLGRRNSARVDPDGIDQITTTITTHENDTAFGEARVTTTLRGDNQADAVVAVESTDGLLRATIIGGNPTVTVTEFNTGGFTRRETTTFPDETTEVLAFDGAGRLASRQLRDIHGTPLESMTRAYNKWGDLEEEENPASGVTAYEFYADGNLKKITVPAPDSGTWTTEWAYFDEQPGRRIETTLPDASTRIEYLLPNGLPHRRHGAGEYPVEFAYGPAGRIASMRTWRTFSDWDTGYDETLWHYNDAGLLERKEYPDGKGTDYTYTPAGLRHTRTWERGVTTTYIYDDAGRPNTTTHSDDTPGIDWTYNRAGRLTGVTDALGTHTLSYEPSGRLQSHTIDGGPLDGLAIVNTFTNGKHEDFTAALDAEDLLLHRHQYDPDTGRLKSVAALDPTAETQIGRADYAYWPESHRTGAITYHNSTAEVLTVETTYDDGLRVETITAEGTTANTLRLFDHTLDPRSRRTRIDREDDTYWSYTYNNRDEVKTGVKHFPGDAPIPGHDFGYTFDNIGNRIEIAREGEDYGYTPNNLNQITERAVPAEHVVTGTADPQADILVNEEPADRVGDFWSKTLTVDNTQFPGYKAITIEATLEGAGPHGQTLLATADGGTFITPQTPESFVYDDDGNLTEDGRNTYTWDANNRLIEVEPLPEFLIISNPQRLEFLYDFQGRRVAKYAYDWNHTFYEWDLVSETYFIYDGWNMVAELQLDADTETLELAQGYLWGTDLSGTPQGAGGVGGLLAVIDHSEGTDVNFAISDANGNVSALVDANGDITAEYGYGPFGEPTKSIGPMAKKNPFRFSTKYTDNETGLVYYGLRYYGPETGRWLNRDPIEEEGGPNLYGFVGNDGVNGVDYLGLARMYICCTEKQKGDIQEAERLAWGTTQSTIRVITRELSAFQILNKYQWIRRHSIEMDGGVSESMSMFNSWNKEILGNLNKMDREFRRNRYIIRCVSENDGDKHAAAPNSWASRAYHRHRMLVYPSFFDLNEIEQGRAIIHEMSHYAAFTDDIHSGATYKWIPETPNDAYFYERFVPNPRDGLKKWLGDIDNYLRHLYQY